MGCRLISCAVCIILTPATGYEYDRRGGLHLPRWVKVDDIHVGGRLLFSPLIFRFHSAGTKQYTFYKEPDRFSEERASRAPPQHKLRKANPYYLEGTRHGRQDDTKNP